MELLRATDASAIDGVLYYDPDPARMNDLRELANSVYSSLNEDGDIG
jgi:hypothetical protein